MPVGVQNLMVTVKGWTFARKRYGKTFKAKVNALMRSQWFSCGQFRELQTTEFRKLLKEAMQNVPYYRDIFSKYSGKIDDIDLDSIREIPLLEKSLLRKNTERFINKSRLNYGYDEGHTSGTSGVPLVWPYDLDSVQYDLAFRERQYRWGGITGKDRSARFSGRVLLGRHNGPPYWRHNAADNQWLFSTYHIADKTLPIYYEVLRNLNFEYIDGYPSALFTIAKWVNDQGKSGQWRPWMINTTAETLMDFQREEIEKAFGCKVFNHYSSSEGAPFVTECPAGRMHLNPESGIIEFLKPDGEPAEPGEEAEMVVTSFFQRTMPLIRYRIGDIGALAEDQICPCGRQMPIVAYIGGRESDTIYTTERGRIGSAGLSTTFYKIPSRLKESQIEQVGADSFVFRYIPLEEPLSEKEKTIVIEQFGNRLGPSVEVDIQIVDHIAKGANGKARLIIGLPDKNKNRNNK
jgi:phenylacetate-CoA ligase